MELSHLLSKGNILAMTSCIAMQFAIAVPVSGQGTWETTLQARDLDGNGQTDAFYDTKLDITWLRNASLSGAMNWSNAMSWASSLDFGGHSDWRLPSMVDAGQSMTCPPPAVPI
jgi:hypothetical protein